MQASVHPHGNVNLVDGASTGCSRSVPRKRRGTFWRFEEQRWRSTRLAHTIGRRHRGAQAVRLGLYLGSTDRRLGTQRALGLEENAGARQNPAARCLASRYLRDPLVLDAGCRRRADGRYPPMADEPSIPVHSAHQRPCGRPRPRGGATQRSDARRQCFANANADASRLVVGFQSRRGYLSTLRAALRPSGRDSVLWCGRCDGDGRGCADRCLHARPRQRAS